MNPETRINELKKRGIFYVYNGCIKLFKFKKVQMYKVLMWINEVTQISVSQDVYQNQDPLELVPIEYRPKQGTV